MPGQPTAGFQRLKIEDWRQFDTIDIEFHPRLTVLTGANGSGKTTLLSILGRHFNWSRVYLNAGGYDETGTRWLSEKRRRRLERQAPAGAVPEGWDEVGSLDYTTGVASKIGMPSSTHVGSQFGQYDIALFAQQPIAGLYLSSHRQLSQYQPVSELTLGQISPEHWFEVYSNELRQRQNGQANIVLQKTPMNWLKQALIASAIFGEGNSSVDPDDRAARIWTEFQQVLSRLFPESLGFESLRVRGSEVMVTTRTGSFPIDEVSGGLSAIVELSWQVFLATEIKGSLTVVFDEPENHLHPTLQRRLIPDLLRAFPSVQFIVATHSPFVVTAEPDSSVYVLDYVNGDGPTARVQSHLLDQLNKAADADAVLRNTLGVGSTMPLWAERRFEEILAAFGAGEPTKERLGDLRENLEESGLGRTFPEALRALHDASEQFEQ